MAGMTPKQRAWRVVVAHKPDPITEAIAAEIEDAVEECRREELGPLRRDLEELRAEFEKLKGVEAMSSELLKLLSARLVERARAQEGLEPVLKQLETIVGACEPQTYFASGGGVSVVAHEMRTWLRDLRKVLEGYKTLVQEGPPVEERTCDKCAREGVGPCEGCSQENPKNWYPKPPTPAGKGG